MTLDELAAEAPFALPLQVPEWTLGAWKRRCITYANGHEDPLTDVIWIQSHGLTGDFRAPAWRPGTEGRSGLGDFSAQELVELACAEGGVAQTGWSVDGMRWEDWCSFQPYDKWPEPGRLERVGTCLVEWAPSGIYVEDWRLLPGSAGVCAGLRLVSETVGGVERPRDGGLVRCGDHLIMTLGRLEPLEDGAPAQAQLGLGAGRVFGALVAYARADAAGWRVELSTDRFLEGARLEGLDGFSRSGEDEIVQVSGEMVRRWRIDTLRTDLEVSPKTPATAEGQAWLQREGGVLLR